ncbi:hypothetical protein [Nocardia farcinica]|uniref:hypothetical protein n=1 Tax=Nocardia farcinica TaxID=37329 RepID=UPI0018944584|nr:hypothetical protein [Nocardia farcinica]MBF6232977.1 hypothetical protein [Nocardia farcinica]
MSPITIARIAAVPVSSWLIIMLTFDADYRTDNMFAVPDAAFSLLLLIGAALPARTAVPTLTVGYLFGAGVITIAALDRFQHGQSAQGVVDVVIVGVYLAVALGLITRAGRVSTPGHA